MRQLPFCIIGGGEDRPLWMEESRSFGRFLISRGPVGYFMVPKAVEIVQRWQRLLRDGFRFISALPADPVFPLRAPRVQLKSLMKNIDKVQVLS